MIMSPVVERKSKPRRGRGVSVPVVGLTFYPGYPDAILYNYPDFAEGLPELVREADNEYDANAVAVYVHGNKIGHLSRQVAETVGPDMDKGVVWKVSSAMVKVHPDKPEQPGVELVIIRDSSQVR
jgi:hypothetical protein